MIRFIAILCVALAVAIGIAEKSSEMPILLIAVADIAIQLENQRKEEDDK